MPWGLNMNHSVLVAGGGGRMGEECPDGAFSTEGKLLENEAI